MKKIGCVLLFLLCISSTAYAKFDIQEAIDRAEPGAVVNIPAGYYKGNLIVTKNITLRGEKGTEIAAVGEEPAIRIEGADAVMIDNMTLSGKKGIVASKVEGLVLRQLKIKDVHSAMHIQHGENVHIQHVEIVGTLAHYSKKGNGIAIYQSEKIVVEDSNIKQVQDGIYVEEVDGIVVQRNTVENSRYGTHFMYTENAKALNNTYASNVTGLMVMMTSGITIKDNLVINHNDMNGSGALLYDVQRADLAYNTMKNNRTAIALQKSAEVQIMHNHFQMNQTAIEGTKVDDQTVVQNNQFTGNILTARSDQQGFQLESNYYDDYVGTDLKNDGTGDVPYVAVSSFGQWMVRQPVYQYFVASPSVVLLTSLDQQINKSARTVLVDETPKLVKDQSVKKADMDIAQFLLGLFFILSSVWLWKRGLME